MTGNLGSILLAGLGISFLIFIHELGHFLAARLFKVRVETFSIGFGPRVAGFRRGETDYRLSLVPLGGYVKMAGEYGDLRDGSPLAADDLTAKPAWQRAVIFAGGVVVNVLFAFVVFPLAFAAGVPFNAPVVGSVVPGGPAWNAGVQPGDEVIAVAGHAVHAFEDIGLEVALADPQDLLLRVRRTGRELDLVLHAERNESAGRWEIGIGQALAPRLAVLPGQAAEQAGLRDGDELVAVGGLAVDPAAGPGRLLARAMGDGRPLELRVRREGAALDLRIEPRAGQDPELLLLGFQPADTRVAALRGAARAAGFVLHRDDLLLAVAGTPVHSADDVLDAEAAAPAGDLSLRLRRDGTELDLLLPAAQRPALAADVAFDYDPGRTVVRTVPGGAVAAAGLSDGDEILALDGEPVADYRDLQRRAQAGGGRRRLTVRTPAGEVRTLEVEARPAPRADYGLAFSPAVRERREDLAGALSAGWQTSLNMLRTTGQTLARLVTGDVAAENLGGIVSISVLTYQFADTGFTKLLFFLGLLSINLAILNILPIPVLDGGQIVFLLLEKLNGGRLSERFLNAAQLAGLLAIVALVLYVTYNDIARLVS